MKQFYAARPVSLVGLLLLALALKSGKAKLFEEAGDSNVESSGKLKSFLRGRVNDEEFSSIIQRRLAYSFLDAPTIATCTDSYSYWTRSEVKNMLDNTIIDLLGGGFVGWLAYTFSGMSSEVNSNVRYGIKAKKICASCTDFTPSSACYQDFCGSTAYGYDATVSGLIMVPTDTSGNFLSGPLKGIVWSHATSENTAAAPSERFKGFATNSDANVLSLMLMAANGHIGIAPDNLGYGESYAYFKSYVIKKAYQTSAVPLWFKAQEIIAAETSCSTELANNVVVSGYSEGGYGAVAVAEAMHCMNVDVIKMQAGGGPFQPASYAVMRIHEDIKLQIYPPDRLDYLVLFGSAYSINPDLVNVNTPTPQLLLANSWTNSATAVTSTITDTVNLTTVGATGGEMVTYLNSYPGDPLDVFDQTLDAWLDDAIADNDVDPCRNGSRDKTDVDLVCKALLKNDFRDHLESLTAYPFELCHGPLDETVAIENANTLDLSSSSGVLVEVEGGHDEAGTNCIRRFANFLRTPDFTSVTPTSSGICATSTTAPATTTQSGPSETEVDFSDFENEDWNDWQDGGGDVALSNYGSTKCKSGSYCVQLRDNSGGRSSMTKLFTAQELSNFNELHVEFSFYADSMENGEDFFLEFSETGGAPWTTAGNWVKGVDFENGVEMDEYSAITTPSSNFNSGVSIRFRCDAGRNDDEVYIDAVKVVGISN